MQTIQFRKYLKGNIPKNVTEDFVKLLKEQGKVKNPNEEKVFRCREIYICYVDAVAVAIGAIKPKTASDFTSTKANIESIAKEFEWELGYCYTKSEYRNRGLSSNIVDMLVSDLKDDNLMASTEIRIDNPMIKILKNYGFRMYGQPWNSTQHGGLLGLYLRVAKKQDNL